MKRMKILIFFLGLTLRMYGPENKVLYIQEPTKIQPYERIWDAVCRAESGNNPFAIGDKNLKKWSYGIAQIREERLSHYNKQTGHRYTRNDLFNPAISKSIFMFYASQIGPYEPEKIIRCWNGGPNGMRNKKTYKYFLTIKSYL